MRILTVFVVATIIWSGATAQEVKTEITTPVSDSDLKPNTDTVPSWYALSGQFQKIMIVRCKYRTDILACLEQFVQKNAIRNAVILSAIGSVRGYHYHIVGSREFPTKNIFVRDTASPADITTMNGYIINGRIHAHILFANSQKAFGGHLETGTSVYTFAIITLGILNDGIDLHTVDEKNYR